MELNSTLPTAFVYLWKVVFSAPKLLIFTSPQYHQSTHCYQAGQLTVEFLLCIRWHSSEVHYSSRLGWRKSHSLVIHTQRECPNTPPFIGLPPKAHFTSTPVHTHTHTHTNTSHLNSILHCRTYWSSFAYFVVLGLIMAPLRCACATRCLNIRFLLFWTDRPAVDLAPLSAEDNFFQL